MTCCRTSTSTRLNEDIYLELLPHLPPSGLASAACVCTGWLAASRSLLYRRLTYDVFSPTVWKLENTLRTCPHIRGLLRHLVLAGLQYHNLPASGLFDWIALLDANSLDCVDLAIRFCDSLDSRRVQKFPAIRTAAQLILRENSVVFWNIDDLLTSPRMDSLSLPIFKPPSVHGMLKLKRLTISLYPQLPLTAVVPILEAIDPLYHLDRFDLRTTWMSGPPGTPHDGNFRPLTQVLQRHLPSMTYFSVFSPQLEISDSPFMDEMILAMSSVRSLCCGYGTYSPVLFARLPPTLRDLTLGWGTIIRYFDPQQNYVYNQKPDPNNPPFPVDQYANAIWRLADRHAVSLRNLTIVMPPTTPTDPAPSLALNHACHSLGIACRVVYWDMWDPDVLYDILP